MIDDSKKSRMLTCKHPVPPDRIQRYVRCHIMLLIGTILFGDKSGAGVHWKFLPLLRDFVNIGQYSWGSACLSHLYRALCRASRYNCREIDGPLTLLLGWVWIRLSYLSPLPREPRSFPLANKFIFSQITPLSSSNEIIKGITRSNGFSQINFTPSLVCNKI
ncbi:hypothetical protein Ahy_B01g052642 [Arachis hypogaea]|uniref:Aminotransferase-like plant mobile domain-containing protein n=1 Tax=Arachis hypogaea TaxID=3818 RepID=A0A445APY5_ARAHY|nr:hypothetical protein Ahy_B01g052642 [Arachis hypogaea]